MAREFEVKLEIPDSTVGKVMRLPWLWEMASGEIQASRMASTYYDTPRYALRQRGITLRVRRVGENRLQTIKAAVNGAALPIERSEWEEQIGGEKPELALAAGTPLEGISRRKLRRDLKPCFEVHVDRSAFPIQSANSAIEIAIDRARLVSEEASATFCEVELELKRGASSELARIARRIASEVPASLALRSKADRGFRLRAGDLPAAHGAQPIKLSAAARVGEAFQQIGWSCLQHFASNADAVKTLDPRGVHEMRIGLRRLEAAIAVFRRLLDGPETDAVEGEAEWLAGELRPACELDVFIEQTLTPLRAAQSDAAALETLSQDTIARRHAALDRAKVAVSSDRYRQFTLRTALWLIAAEWADKADLGPQHPSRHIAPLARSALSERTRRLLQQVEHFRQLDAPEREKLRLAAARLRYAIDFFVGVFGRRRRDVKRFQASLGRIEKELSRLNDIAVNARLGDGFMESWIEELAAEPPPAQKAFAMGFVLGQQQQEKELCLAAIDKERRRLAACAPAWR